MSFLKSLRYAIRGIGIVIRHEHNFRVQLSVAVLIGVAMAMLRVSAWEGSVLVVVMGLVLVLECLNSAMERLMDLLKPRLHEYVQEVKDMMAAAVLVASATAVVVGVLILGPYLFKL